MSEKAAVSLKVMAEDKEVDGVGKVTSFAVDPTLLRVKQGFNARPLDKDHVESIATSYENGAIFPPLDVWIEDGEIFVLEGHHRRAGALLAIERGAQIRSVECRQFRGNEADRVAHMCGTDAKLPLTALQLGAQYRKLLAWGWPVTEICNKPGRKPEHVNSMVALAESPLDVQAAVQEGHVSVTNAVKIVKKEQSSAGAVIKKAVEKARLDGKQKATTKHIAGSTPKNLPEAIKAEMDSGGSFRAEVLCPRYADLITYLRGTAQA